MSTGAEAPDFRPGSSHREIEGWTQSFLFQTTRNISGSASPATTSAQMRGFRTGTRVISRAQAAASAGSGRRMWTGQRVMPRWLSCLK